MASPQNQPQGTPKRQAQVDRRTPLILIGSLAAAASSAARTSGKPSGFVGVVPSKPRGFSKLPLVKRDSLGKPRFSPSKPRGFF